VIELLGQRSATATSEPTPIERFRLRRTPRATSDVLIETETREIEADTELFRRVLHRLNAPAFVSADDALRHLAEG